MANGWTFLLLLTFLALRLKCVESNRSVVWSLLPLADNTKRPNQDKNAVTVVDLSINLRAVTIDGIRQRISISADLRQEWVDIRLQYNMYASSSLLVYGHLGDDVKQKMWLPNVMAYETTSYNTGKDDFIEISPAGQASWLQVVHFEVPCDMDLKSYPLGSFKCELKFGCMGFGHNELKLQVADENAIETAKTKVSIDYKLKRVSTKEKNPLIFGKTIRQIVVILELENVSGWIIKHTVIPMSAAVTTAYLAFYINIRAIAARMITCCMSFLIAAIFHENTYHNVPRPAETTALEIFTGTCMTFIWIVAVECVVVDILMHLNLKRSNSPHSSFALEHPDVTDEGGSTKGLGAAVWIDRCFRVLYPAAFIAFNAVYWVLYL